MQPEKSDIADMSGLVAISGGKKTFNHQMNDSSIGANQADGCKCGYIAMLVGEFQEHCYEWVQKIMRFEQISSGRLPAILNGMTP